MADNKRAACSNRKKRRREDSTGSESPQLPISATRDHTGSDSLSSTQRTNAHGHALAARSRPWEDHPAQSGPPGSSHVRNTKVQGSGNSLSVGNVTYNFETSTSRILDGMPYATGAGWDEAGNTVDRCVEGTRSELLGEIKSWLGKPGAKDNTGGIGFWLQGMAGTGKSTIARTVAEDMKKEGFVVASFFFLRGDGKRGSPDIFVGTILRQLIEDPSLKQCDGLQSDLISTYESNTVARSRRLEDQWQTFIKEPLLSHDHTTILLVVDAVDESTELMGMEQPMFDFLSNEGNFTGLDIRVFVTCRPQRKKENEGVHRLFHLHKIDEKLVEKDIRLFLRVKFSKFNEIYNPGSAFPGDEEIQELTRRSSPLFIAAMTSFKFIIAVDYDPESQFNLLMEQPNGSVDYEDLDKMYFVVLKQAIVRCHSLKKHSGLIQKTKEVFRDLIGTIITLHEPFDYENLATLLSRKSNTVREFIRSLSAVLDIPKASDGPVRILHQSFPDFLWDESRVKAACEGQGLETKDILMNGEHCDARVFLACLQVMEGADTSRGCFGLRQDICGLVGPGKTAKDIPKSTLETSIPAVLRYACKYWASHFILAGGIGILNSEHLLNFLARHLLHWIEAMSCLGNLHDAIRNLDQVLELLQKGKCRNSELCELVADSTRFIRYCKDGVEEAPLQVYSSALIFAPEKSKVKQRFLGQRSSWIRNSSKMDLRWSPVLHQLATGISAPCHFEFSADGKRIISRNYDQELIVWDTATGESLDRADTVTWVDLSCNDTLVWADTSGRTYMWPRMEKRKERVLCDGFIHECEVKGMTYSPDGRFLASIDKRDVVILRDAQDDYRGQRLPRDDLADDISLGSKIRISSETHAGAVRCCPLVHKVQRSGTFLVCLGASPDTLEVWDMRHKDQKAKELPLGGKGWARLVHLPDSNSIIAPDESGSLRIYDLLDLDKSANQCAAFGVFQDSTDVEDLSILADGAILAGLLDFVDVGFWDVCTGNKVGFFSRPRSCNYDYWTGARLSPDGKMIAIVDEFTLQLLGFELLRQHNLESPATAESSKEWHEFQIQPAVSANGGFVAVAMSSGGGTSITVDVWATDTSQKRSFQSQYVKKYCETPSLTFSSKGKWLALSDEWKIEVWDLRDRCHSLPRRSISVDQDSDVNPEIIHKVTFSENEELVSFACHVRAAVAVVRLESEDPPTYHSFLGNRIEAISALGQTLSFCTVLYDTSPCLQIFVYGIEEDSAVLYDNFESRVPFTEIASSAFSPAKDMLAITPSTEGSTIVAFTSGLRESGYSFQYNPFESDSFSLCSRGRCFVSLWGSVFHASWPHLPRENRNIRCDCGLIPVSGCETQDWLLWQGKPFLWIPPNWRFNEFCMVVGKETVAYCDRNSVFWLKLDREVGDLVKSQPKVSEDPNYVRVIDSVQLSYR